MDSVREVCVTAADVQPVVGARAAPLTSMLYVEAMMRRLLLSMWARCRECQQAGMEGGEHERRRGGGGREGEEGGCVCVDVGAARVL